MPRLRITNTPAPAISPNTAPEAPTVRPTGVTQERPEGPGQQRHEVDQREAKAADRRLEHLPEHVEGVHVEADVDQARVQEAGGDEAPLVAVARP